ncbi:MAG: hypothetical protein ABI548_28985 [Polyangiaceae bacterium]
MSAFLDTLRDLVHYCKPHPLAWVPVPFFFVLVYQKLRKGGRGPTADELFKMTQAAVGTWSAITVLLDAIDKGGTSTAIAEYLGGVLLMNASYTRAKDVVTSLRLVVKPEPEPLPAKSARNPSEP